MLLKEIQCTQVSNMYLLFLEYFQYHNFVYNEYLWEDLLGLYESTVIRMFSITAHLLVQPQQKLQLDYKTNIQNHQKIKLYGSLTTKALKKPHSSRQVGGAETCREAWRPRDAEQMVPYPRVIDKNRVITRVRDPSPTPDHWAQGSSARKISSYNFWL